jgi:probable F420-dependent oxidoreductase
MRLGIWLPTGGRSSEDLISLAQEAEASSFDSLWVGDHFLKVLGPILDPLATLAFVAGATRRLRLGTNVLVLPYRHPVVLANEAASLDVLSNGRFTLGVGVGWSEEEFAAVGIPRRQRGRCTDEGLEAMKALWGEESASYAGRFFSFEDTTLGTAPRTSGGPPILVGGYSDGALKRALRFGDAWGGFMDSPGRIVEVRERLTRFGKKMGPEPREVGLVTTYRLTAPPKLKEGESAEDAAEELGRLAEAGVGLCVLAVSPTTPDTLSWAAEEVAPLVTMAGGPVDGVG